MPETEAIIREIENYCRQTNTAESTFGRRAVNDGKFMARLREGKSVTLKTLNRVHAFMHNHPPEADINDNTATRPHPGGGASYAGLDQIVDAVEPERPFRFYDNRQKYLAFVNTCNEKVSIARRASKEIQHIQPRPPALKIFDAGMGDATVLSLIMRDMHRRFPHVPFFINAKEISLEDVRLGLEKMPDRFFEHPSTVLVITNLNYSEAPKLMPGNVNAAAALNWHEIRLQGGTSYEYGEQIQALDHLLVDGWQTRISSKTGNPLYMRPSVLVIYREDHKFLLENVVPHQGHFEGLYDFILASQPWRARMNAGFKAQKVLKPLSLSLAPSGRMLAIQSYGKDPAQEIIRKIWPDEQPFLTNRHELLNALKQELGRDARDFNFNAGSDAKSIFQYQMHTLPSEISDNIGTSTLFAAWNAAIYVNQIEDEKLEDAISSNSYIKATSEVLKKHGGLWFNDETFVISRKRA
jgi:hypothetical protein